MQKGWDYSDSGVDQLQIRPCPLCNNSEKFYINVSGESKDGLWDCKKCGEAGNLFKLMEKFGDRIEGLQGSLHEFATSGRPIEPLPNVHEMHRRLMEDDEALDYLVADRGFKIAAIEKQKLGLEELNGKKWLSIPYSSNGVVVFVKFRSIPPVEKAFRSTAGREAPLYNEDVIKSGMEEVLFVEGECDAISVISSGEDNVVGVPGANVQKATWISRLDAADPKKIFILYDNDKVGQKAARAIAEKIGIEKCFNILLPEFTTFDGKPGKDINEWMRAGRTLREAKDLARPFDVEGVTGIGDAIGELQDELESKGNLKPVLDTPWPSLNAKFGGFEFGDVVGLIAEGKVGKTTMALNMADYACQKGFNVFFYCLEMPPKQLARKWISYATKTPDSRGESKITVETIKTAKGIAFERLNNGFGDMLFGYTRGKSSDHIFNTIRQAVRRYGVKFVVFDNLQFLVRSIDHSAQEMSVISKQFKELAMELGIIIFLIIQPNRVREGEIVAARNANGSSAIEKDVDAMIALHRNRVAKIKANDFVGFLDADDNFEPQMLVRVDLSRFASGGVCTLWVDGEISTVREFTDIDRMAMPMPNMSGGIQMETQTI
jgi:KaiC/GvpD/RAD55 family RecA-like ATPase/5S rRNA maturation endonuclease (ribonuclease M5)